MKKLIIAEKPSLAKNIIAGIGNSKFKKDDGFYESDNYIVTWAFGHLFSLIDIEEYDSDYDATINHPWTIDNLPFTPSIFKFELKKDAKTKKVDAGVRKQYNTIKSLINRKDVSTIVNAGDADREGEIIVRLILDHAANKKPVERLWMPDQTPETIRNELSAIKRDSLYDNLANEGMARTYIDWLYGVNLTRYSTLKSGTLLRVGRVIVPIVEAIYDRDMAIKNFIPERYFSVTSKENTNGEIVELTSKENFSKDKKENADALCKKYNSSKTVVTDVKTERKTIAPGRLYSLSKSQGVLGKKYKMSLKQSLEVIQRLYEAGYITYPRTNTEYLATAEKDKVKSILNNISAAGYPVTFKDSPSIFDDSKIESHSALTPTTKLPKKGTLSDLEQKVYDTIFNRFIAVFCSESCEVDRSVIEIDNGYEVFTLKGDVMVQKGWTQYDESDKKDKILPRLKKGDIVAVDFKPINKETNPPKHYTLETLNNFLKNPYKDDSKEDEDDDYKAIMSGAEIGTEATRTGIIDNAIKSGYINLKDNAYYIQDAGIYYIETLKKLNVNMDKTQTVKLGVMLKKIFKQELTIQDGISYSADRIKEIFTRNISVEKATFSKDGETIGKCPKCGTNIIETAKAYSCKNKDCGFVLWKDNKYLASMGKKLTKSMAKQFIEKGYSDVKGLKSKSGKVFDARIKCEVKDNRCVFSLDFGNQNQTANTTSIGKCPKCGADIIETAKTYSCKNKDCGFAIWKEDKFLGSMGKSINTSIAKSFLSHGEAKLKGLKSKKTGKVFDATVKVDYSGKYPQYKVEF